MSCLSVVAEAAGRPKPRAAEPEVEQAALSIRNLCLWKLANIQLLLGKVEILA